MAVMELLTAIPMIIDDIARTGAGVMTVLAHKLLTIALAALIIGGVTGFALAGFAWAWLRRAMPLLLHPRPSPAAF